MSRCWNWFLLLLLTIPLQSSPPATFGQSNEYSPNGDLELVEQLLFARRQYQTSLEKLRAHYIKVNDLERAKWAEEELIQFHRIPKHAFRLDLDVPPPTLKGSVNIPSANKLYTRALGYVGQGWGNDYIDNQRRAEILLRQLLTHYPQSNRISDTAFQLAKIYESKPYNQHKRAAVYYERCYQWNPTTHFDARLRAARIYDQKLLNREKAMAIYKEVTLHETEPARIQEAVRRMKQLSSKP